MTEITADYARALLPARPAVCGKADFGSLLIIAGSTGFSGAAWFAASAAVRSGVGTVTVGVPESIWNQVAPGVREAMCFPLPCDAEGKLSTAAFDLIFGRLERCTAVLCGPGMGRGPAPAELVRLLCLGKKPLILDADGINNKKGHIINCPLVLTPHEGEFLRLGGNLSNGREAGAAEFVAKYPCTLVLKGHKTIVASPAREMLVNPTGNPGMAKGGSGDVLAGVIGALAAQGLQPHDAAAAGVWVHGMAGDMCAKEKGFTGMIPSDIVDALPGAFKLLET